MSSSTVSKITDMQCLTMIAGFCDPRGRAAERIVLVMDQLNTHAPASLSEAFPPGEAKRLAERLENFRLGHAFGRAASSNLQKNSDNPSQGEPESWWWRQGWDCGHLWPRAAT